MSAILSRLVNLCQSDPSDRLLTRFNLVFPAQTAFLPDLNIAECFESVLEQRLTCPNPPDLTDFNMFP
jgi:hypothetical protein